MEQLAQFVTKSFEYNNNRVLDLLNVAIQVDINRSKSYNNSDDDSLECDGEKLNQNDEEESVEINITDLSGTSDSTNTNTEKRNESEKPDTREENSTSPLPLIKKNNNNICSNNNNLKKCVTKNWLISDNDKESTTQNNQKDVTDENVKPKNSLHPNISLTKLSSSNIDVEFQLRPKPVTELLKEIRKFNDLTPPPLSTRLDNNYESRSSSPTDNEQTKGFKKFLFI